MKIRFKNQKYLKSKIAFCVLMFAFGLYIFTSILPLLLEQDNFEYSKLTGRYISYREDSTAGYAGFNRHVYLTVELSNNDKVEYEINPVSLVSFKTNDFLGEVNEGDYVELTIEDDYYILEIISNGRLYLEIQDTLNNDRQNWLCGCFLGGVFMILSAICFFTLFKRKKVRYKK